MSRVGQRIAWFVGVMIIIAKTLGASAQEACIGEPARAAVTACAGATARPSATAGVPQHVAPVVRTTAAAPTPSSGVPGFDLDPGAALRTPVHEGATIDLLDHEVATLSRILERTTAASPRHAEYLQRLADTYFELETAHRAHARRLDQPIFEAAQAGDATALRAEQTAAETGATTARDAAVRTYAQLVNDHPDLPTLDEVLFSLAFGLEEGHHFDEARQVYLRLVRDFPASRFVPHAWLSFGEYYFDQGDMSAAGQFYARVLETPPEAPNPVYGYALYKQGWVAYNQEDFQGALTRFARVIEFAEQHPDARDASSLARQARHELVLPYARVGRPAQALAFFRRYATEEPQAFEMLESLGELYVDTGQWPQAIQVYHLLMSERPASDALCQWQAQVTSAVISSRPKPEQVTEAHRLVDVMNAFAGASHPEAATTECRQAAAGVLVELATAWHREAVGDGTQPGTNDHGTMRLAAELYALAVAELPDMDRLEYPDIDRRDWPTLYRVSYFQAELLWGMDDFHGCGPAFGRVVELAPEGEFSADASYGEVLCYDRIYQAEYVPHEREREAADPDAPPAPARALTELESSMARAFQRYLCTVPDGDERATVQYRLGRIYYEARHFEEASVAFRAVAVDHASSDLGEIAANLHLDSLEALRRRDQRTSCVAALNADLDPLDRLYCADADAAAAHPDLCPVIVGLHCDLYRLEAENLALAGAHRRAAPRYVALARDHVECGRRDEMLWNAAIEYEAAHLLGRAVQVRRSLALSFPDSVLTERAMYLLGANYHALAIYSEAADWYERFARARTDDRESACAEGDRTAGTCGVAHLALENAVFFRAGLGEDDAAIADATLYAQRFRRSRPHETAEVVFSLGALHEARGDWTAVATHYRAFLRDYGRSARPDQIARANVELGRAAQQAGRPDLAAPFFRAAVSAWEHSGDDAIARLEGTDADHALWAAHAREAASEARYALAEERFEAFRAIRFPRFDGQRTLSSVMRWSTRELGPWLARRFEALHEAEAAYDQIAPLGVPEWQIAAAERVGEMYRSIVDDVRSAPVPAEIEDDDELYGIYIGTLERVLNGSTAGTDGTWDTADDVMCTEASTEPSCTGAPLRQATERFAYCLTLATRVRWFDERSAACERELNAMDAVRYPMAAELRGTASYDEDELAPPAEIELDDDDTDVPAPDHV